MIEMITAPERPQSPIDREPFHTWDLPLGTPWARFYRLEGCILLRFPDMADFEVLRDGHKVKCIPVPGTAQATIEHLFQNQVQPLALSKMGKLVFHASAVDIKGNAVAFLAESGRGKSTLAAKFAVSGYRFLTDDGLLLEPSASGYTLVPNHASIRLWKDSFETVLPAGTPTAPPLDFTTKDRILAGEVLPYCDQPRPFRCAYFLGDGSADDIAIRVLKPVEALVQWASHSFLLDIEDRKLTSAHFNGIAELAERVPAYLLDYPRRYEKLPQVLDAIVAHVTELGSLS